MKNLRYYPFERNRFFYGKLLTVRDFDSEQKYFNDKRRLINKLLLGSGVVCGLQVVAIDDQTISVEAGVALDSAGREIVVASPVTQKLSMIDGFVNNEYAKNVYLCIAYAENGKEPVHTVAGTATQSEEVSEYNRIQEGYRIFVREEAPDPSSIGFNRLVEENCFIYQDDQVRIRQKTPRYVSPGGEFELTLVVEKTLQTPQIQVEYELASEHFQSVEGGALQVSFTEPEYGQATEYEASFKVRAGNFPDTKGTLAIKGGRAKIRIGDKQLDIETECSNTVHIIEGPIREKVLSSYFDLSLDQCTLCSEDECIYLAKISLLHMGRTYVIDKIDCVPFDEYVYNASLLYSLGLLEGGDDGRGGGETVPDASAEPEPPIAGGPDAIEMTTGIAEIEMEINARAGRSYYSEEIEHGLGKGPVFIQTALEDTENVLFDNEDYREPIYYGSNEVFLKSPFASTMPAVLTGTVLFPEKGTFRIGIRLLTGTKLLKMPVRWWAYRK